VLLGMSPRSLSVCFINELGGASRSSQLSADSSCVDPTNMDILPSNLDLDRLFTYG
jgi:hypothetical protein